MAKKAKDGKKPSRKQEEDQPRVTLEALDAISSEDEEGLGGEEWNAEVLALRQAMADGAFDHLVTKSCGVDSKEDDDFEEVDLDSENSDEEESNQDEDSESNEDQDHYAKKPAPSSDKALVAVLDEMTNEKKGMPWAETFDVMPAEPLPFGEISNEGNPLGIHDDLHREVVFYNLALESVKEARRRCNDVGIPFSRPDDFFAEMVKTDDHMAMVKDRLIFETKKMDAVAQRKSNKEQKLRSKEKHANKLAEKAKRKKDHFKAVNEWQKSAASNRGQALRDDEDGAYLAQLGSRGWTDRDGNLQSGPNKKRMAADKKYGHGGKRGRFKQNDAKSLNDMSDFNPRGNYSGGQKGKGGGGAKRQGKRARDAARARR